MNTDPKTAGKKSSRGIGLCTGTFLVFAILKLTQIGLVASWSWWWVFSPLWIPIALIISGLFVYCIVYMIVIRLKKIKYKRQQANSNYR